MNINKIKYVNYIDPVKILGKSLRVFLKYGGNFYFKVTAVGGDFVAGYDDEGLNLYIKIEDIDYYLLGDGDQVLKCMQPNERIKEKPRRDQEKDI